MADSAIARLLKLLEADGPEDVRRASVLVLGEIGAQDKEVGPALFEHLDDADAIVRAEVIRALGKLQYVKAVPRLLERIEHGGEESELAAQAVGHMGSKGAHALQDLMTHVPPGLRRRIAGALGSGGTTSAESAAVDSLLDSDSGVVEAATRSLISKVPALSPVHKKALAEHLLALLANKKKPLTNISATAVLRLLAALDDPRIGKILWDRLRGGASIEQRAAVLQALRKWCTAPTREQLNKLLVCACDGDFRVAAPALMLLQGVAPDMVTDDWLSLFNAVDTAVQRFAIERLGARDTPAVAAALVELLSSTDAGVHDAAVNRLGTHKHGRKALQQAIEKADNVDAAWRLARAIAGWASELPTAARNRLLDLACRHLEKGDRLQEPLLFVLRKAGTALVDDALRQRADSLRQKKKYETALVFLRHLLRDPACAVEIRLEAMGCSLRLSSKDLAGDNRSTDFALQQLARLAPNYEAECLEFLQKARWLTPEDLFFVGFHFAEQNGALRNFGGKVLKLVLKKAGKSKIARDARAKILSSGLGE